MCLLMWCEGLQIEGSIDSPSIPGGSILGAYSCFHVANKATIVKT